MNYHNELLSIQQISRKLDIPRPTLRFWEKELEGIIIPLRTLGGQRRYTNEHMIIIRKIKELRERGKKLTEIKMALNGMPKSQNENPASKNVDFLANRIAQVVRNEIYSLFQKGDLDQTSLEKIKS